MFPHTARTEAVVKLIKHGFESRTDYGMLRLKHLMKKKVKKFQKSVDKRKRLWYTNIVVTWEKRDKDLWKLNKTNQCAGHYN